MISLSETEKNALIFLHCDHGGSILITGVPDKNEKGIHGEIVPGIPVYKKLEKKNLLYFTIEDEMPDGFKFTESIELTDEGIVLAKQLLKHF